MSENKLSFTKEQEAAINFRGGALLVSAAAGSGKTKVLVERLLAQIETDASIDEFLVITYTRAAAAELREKIYDEIMERLSKAPDKRKLRRQSLLCRGAPIGTIHSFCTDILRENAHQAGLTPDFRVADESEAEMLKADVLENTIAEAYESGLKDFGELVDLVSPGRDDKRLAGIVMDLYARLQSDPNPREWAERQKKQLRLENIGDISQTVWGSFLLARAGQAAAFWLEEMKKLRVQASSFTDFEKSYGGTIDATIFSITQFLDVYNDGWDKARAKSGIDFSGAGRIRGYDELKDIRNRCKEALKKCMSVFEYSSDELMEDMHAVAPPMTALLDLVMSFDDAYAVEKRKKGIVDFSDLEHLTLSMLVNPDTGLRTGLASSISKRYREIMVDEYQDVNAVQEMIFNAVSQDGRNIFMVGDVKQSIYRFRLADPTIFLDKYGRFNDFALSVNSDAAARSIEAGRAPSTASVSSDRMSCNGTKIMLSKNFRSKDGILSAANFVFEKIMSEKFGEMDYTEREKLVPGREDAHDDDVSVEMNIISMTDLDSDEDEESPKKTQIEAQYIARRISELTDGEHFIPDGKGGTRAIEISDIVILMRSVKNKAWQYAAALAEYDIPVDMPGGEGYFETLEVSAALSLLEIIDNPMQDIALVATLGGPIYRFSADELAEIRAGSKKTDFYSALIRFSYEKTQLLTDCDDKANKETNKVTAFLSELEEFRLVMPDMPADRFIWHVFNKTGLLEIVETMRAGSGRRDNLILLAETARAFEAYGYKGLFGFLTYIRGLIVRGSELHGDVGVGDASSNAVRIMSVHKSKGLEFPVVFLADTSKRLNNADAQQPLLLHTKYGLGPMRTDLNRRIQYTTIARMAVQQKLTTEMMAEELRVLYVAMTRAREKMIITAAFKDAQKELAKYASIAASCKGESEPKIAPQLLEGISTTAGWILAAHASVPDGDAVIAVSILGQDDGVERELEGLKTGVKAADIENNSAQKGRNYKRPFDGFKYPYPNASELPSKLTVTALRGLENDAESAVLTTDYEKQAHKRPAFITEISGLTAAERGTAFHTAMQHIDYKKGGDLRSIEEELTRLSQKNLLTKEQIASINRQKIANFFNSGIGKRASAAKNIKREFKFSLLYPASEFYPEGGEDNILFQGVIDCFFEENGELTVLDYKTDHVTEETIHIKAEQYAPQLHAYAKALKRITGKNVKQCIIYFFSKDFSYVIEN